MEGKALLFVYGSLLEGEANHALLVGARFVRACRTAPCFDLFDLGPFPAMTEGGRKAVVGELYEVDAWFVDELDAFEGHPDLFRRVTIHLDDGSEALAYVAPRELAANGALIASGDYRRRG